MVDIAIVKINETYMRVSAENDILAELYDLFTFEVPNARYQPKFKAGLWDGKIRLLNYIKQTLYIGLLDYVKDFARRRDLSISITGFNNDIINSDDIKKFVSSLNLAARGASLEVRPYQLDAIIHAITTHRSLPVVPTGGGKSMIIYSFIRWHIEHGRKCIIVVPSTVLVEQLFSDFKDYSSINKWNVDDNCQKIYSGYSKNITHNCTITTWQSAHRLPDERWFSQFDVVVGDECHLFQAQALTGILEKMTKAQYRMGVTGSLKESKSNKLCVEGLFGTAINITTTKKLIEQKSLSDLKIRSLIIKHNAADRKYFNKREYKEEIEFLVTHHLRNKFITRLALATTGNTLVLFQYVEKQGRVLYDMLKNVVGDSRPIIFVHGGVSTEVREGVRNDLANMKNAIVVASYGTSSTGLNIPSIENVIFASPSKSRVRNLQSIGRGLRLNNGKTHCKLFDITDDLQYKSYKNHTLRHGAERYKLYLEEGFDIKLTEVIL